MGEQVRLQCPHNGSSNTNVTWWHVLQVNSSWPPVMYPGALGPKGELIIQQVNKSHRGMYRCQVTEGKKIQRSCGTYLRVRGECPSRPASGKAGWSPSLPASRASWVSPSGSRFHGLGPRWGRGQGRGQGQGGALSRIPSSQSRSPGPSWTWGRVRRTTSSPPRASSSSSAPWCLGRCCFSG